MIFAGEDIREDGREFAALPSRTRDGAEVTPFVESEAPKLLGPVPLKYGGATHV
jgi:hypothetical protein